MKIWYQSAMDLGINPAWNEYMDALNTYLGQIARSDTEIVVRGTEAFILMIERSYYAELLVEPQVVKAAIRAEQEGYDAFCVGCTLDPAYYEIREVVDIPVCSLSETSMYLASLLGRKFSILAFNKEILVRMTELAQRYGLQDKLVPSNPLDITASDIQAAFNNPRIILDSAEEVAEEAAKRGAGMLITSSGEINMIMRKYAMTEISGVPVLQGSGALLKMAELMVDLDKIGIKRSKLAFPSVTKTELTEIKKIFSRINLI